MNSELEIERWPIDNVRPYEQNPRKIPLKNDHAVDWMVASVQEFGFKIPILARRNGAIVVGFLRWKAAQKLGMTEVPVILCDEWSEVRLMVNRSEMPVTLCDGMMRLRRRTA
jgi:ParB-like chromosome segregation protein Spo0J